MKIPKRNLKLENDPTVGSLVHKNELIKTTEEVKTEAKETLSEVKNTLSTKTSEIDEAINTLEETTVQILEHVKTITKGAKGESAPFFVSKVEPNNPKEGNIWIKI